MSSVVRCMMNSHIKMRAGGRFIPGYRNSRPAFRNGPRSQFAFEGFMATMALTLALPETGPITASRLP
jgi:hypothetical protein